MKTILTFLIRLYQMSLSHILGGCCRFYPTCSEYALQAIRVHGSVRGSALAAIRLCKCHPFHHGGFDPVPERRDDERHGSLQRVVNLRGTCEAHRIP